MRLACCGNKQIQISSPSAILLSTNWREQFTPDLVQQFTMIFTRVDRACVREAGQARAALSIFASIIFGLLSVTLQGCGQQPDPPALARRPHRANPQAALAENSSGTPNQPVNTPAAEGH